jgi:hypothetical protein
MAAANRRGATVTTADRPLQWQRPERWVWVTDEREPRGKNAWNVVDGNLRCDGAPKGYIRTKDDYTSFVLTMQVRQLKPGGGGLLLRVVGKDKVWPKGIGVDSGAGAPGDIWNSDEFSMEVDPRRTAGGRTKRIQTDTAEKPIGEWNDYEIKLVGEELTVKLNGALQNVAWKVTILPGKIALRSNGGVYEVRKLKLRRTPNDGFFGFLAD